MSEVIGPVEITASSLRHPLTLPDGRKMYQIETAENWYAANELPMIRAADGQPMALLEEPAAGSRVLLVLDDQDELRAVKLLDPVWDDPFSI